MSDPIAAARRQKAQKEVQQVMQERFSEHVRDFSISLEFPAAVSSASSDQPVRTSAELIQHRLLESGVLFSDTQSVAEVTEAVADFCTKLERSGCFKTVQVKIGGGPRQLQGDRAAGETPPEQLEVVLNEKKWYRLYIGGGLKQEGLMRDATDSLVPKVQFETSAGMLNLSGKLDTTSLQYTVDQTASSSLSFLHERPLYTFLPEHGNLYTSLLTQNKGSQVSLALRALLDTVDYEWTRSYKEYQRLLGARVSNASNVAHPETAKEAYTGLDWSVVFRDLIPRRHSTLPYAADASPEIVAQAGASLKHALTLESRTNGSLTDDRFNPTLGVDANVKFEVAGPPGDVGFIKIQGGLSWNGGLDTSSVFSSVALHSSLHAGILQPLTFGGLCGPPTISDRFFVGGPMQLRGFVPAGIGPRAKTGGSSTPAGDSLGGDIFYNATIAASVPFPGWKMLQENGVRLFGFCNAGTLATLDGVCPISILKSSRAAIGGGLCAGTPFGRLEATYAVPIRYGPRDARRSVQLGFGFTFG